MAEADVDSFVRIVDESTNFLTSFGVPRVGPKVQESWFGKVRVACTEFSYFEWIYLVGSIIVLLASLALTIERFIHTRPCQCDFAFGLLLILTICFCGYYVLHSVFTERWMELGVFILCNFIVMGYCIVNYVNGEKDTLKWFRLVLACLAGPVLIISGAYLFYKYIDFNRFIHDAVNSANPDHQKTCRTYYICSSLLKFDLQLQLSMLILVIGRYILDMDLTEKLIFLPGLPVIILVFIFGKLGIRYESKIWMILFYILSLLERVYIIYNLNYTYTKGDNVGATYNPVFVCGVSALVIWLLLFGFTSYFWIYHFGKGNKERLFGRTGENRRSRLVPITNINQESHDGNRIEETIEQSHEC